MLRSTFARNSSDCVNGGINIPPKSFLGWLYRGDHIAEGHFPNDQQVDVTGGMELAPCGRAEHERRVHAFASGISASRKISTSPTVLAKRPCSSGKMAAFWFA